MPTKKNKVTKKSAKKAPKKTVTPPVAPPPPAPPPAPPAPPKPVLPVRSEADKIWDEIKNLPIQMFGLPDQYVVQHCTPIPVEPSVLYVTVRSSATLPSLEAAIAPAFVVELADKFVLIKRAPKPLIPSKQR
jgi:hypothetical protein